VHLRVINTNKFGFKAVCAGTVKKVINYYTAKGSYVFACFVNLSKAFDRVNYWKVFSKLLSDGVDIHLVKLLAYWHVYQEVSVR